MYYVCKEFKTLNNMNKVGEKIEIEELKKGRRFDAQTLISQLYAGGRSKVWSWGFHNPIAYADKNGCYVLRFTVRGNLFRGHIYVALNGADLYDVYYCSNRGNIKMISEGLYCDNITEVIDEKIEKIASYQY